MRQSDVNRVAFPKPGPVLWSVLSLTTVLGLVTAGSRPAAAALFDVLACEMGRALTQPWRLVSAALLAAPPERWSVLVFGLLGLYFLGAPLEERWGPRRFLGFIVLAASVGNLAAVAADRIVGGGQVRFHPGFVHGPAAVISALSVAWAREFADRKVSVFFVLPMRAKNFVWLTLALCLLNFAFPEGGIPEGAIAPLGGMAAGYAFGGSPSPARRLWLRVRLAWLRRSSAGDAAARRRRGGPRNRSSTKSWPPLSVIPGGLEDIFDDRTPPKDKRDLN
jgi:membrane associated rhomboid family serine protease